MPIIKSKDWIIIVIGIIISFLLSSISFLKGFDFKDIQNIYLILITSLIFIFLITWILHKRINENNEELEDTKLEQKRLGEKLKIYELLIDMKAEIKELQNRCSNGKRK